MTAMPKFEFPYSPDAERYVIGTAVLDGSVPPVARDLATTEFSLVNNHTWAAILELDADGMPIEPTSVCEIVRRNKGDLTVPELMQMTSGIPHNFNPAVYVEKIQSCALRRERIRELNDEIKAVASGKLELSSVRRNSFVSLSDIIEREVKPALQDLRHGITHRISTGFPRIDNVIGGGLSTSDVLLVAALTGQGKSAFVLQMAFNIAFAGYPVGFLSGEMSNRENVLRLLSQQTKFMNLNAVTEIDDSELNWLNKSADLLKDVPLYFDSKSFDMQTISRNVRELVKNHGIKVLVLDYIQLLKLNRFDKQTRFERISECSQEVKRLASELEIAVIEVAQFNREGAKSGKPKLHDLDGASQLEKDISLCFILDRDGSDNINLRVEKGRNAGKCEIAGRFTGINLNFEF